MEDTEGRNKKILLLMVVIALLVLLVVGVSIAFFSYTKTGNTNTIETGNIYFYMNQDGVLNIENIFPMTSEEAATSNLDTIVVSVRGETTYSNGEEFVISMVNVDNVRGSKTIPINYTAKYEAINGGIIGTNSNDYWNARESKNASIYTLNATGEVVENNQVLVGYIKGGTTGINGRLTIKVFLDKDKIAITDTYPPGDHETLIDGNNVIDYTNGTTSEWVDDRMVFTTSEWNSLQSTPMSFKIKSIASEGVWVTSPAP